MMSGRSFTIPTTTRNARALNGAQGEAMNVLATFSRAWHAGRQQRRTVSVATTAYANLVYRYRERHRRYHALEHVRHCLDELDWYKRCASVGDEPFEALSLALWFHDAVYSPIHVPGTPSNEERSAALAVEWLRGDGGFSEAFIRHVSGLVLATAHLSKPVVPVDVPGVDLMTDIDLAILGADPETFDQYERDIRQEYSHVVLDQLFIKGRLAVIDLFLKPGDPDPRIYRTEAFREKYEVAARQNLTRSKLRLRQGVVLS